MGVEADYFSTTLSVDATLGRSPCFAIFGPKWIFPNVPMFEKRR